MPEPMQKRETDPTGTQSVRRVRQAAISNPCLGLVTWLDEFDQALIRQDFACCRSLLLEIQEEGYPFTQQEQVFVKSRQAAFSFCLGLHYHLRNVYETARHLYRESRELHRALGDDSGEGQTILALEELDKEPARQDTALLEQFAAKPRVLGDCNALLIQRLATLPLAEQINVITIAKQKGYARPLQAALQSPHPQVQAAASAAWTWLKPGPDYQTVLNVMLPSPNWLVRWQATCLLQQALDARRGEFVQASGHIANALAQRLRDGEADALVRRNIALLLGRIKATSDTPLLIELLADPDPDVRYAAIEAITDLGDERAVAPLQQVQPGFAFSGNDIVEAAGRAILRIQRRLPPTVGEVVLCTEITAQKLPVQAQSSFSVQEPPRYCVVIVSNWTPTLEITCQVSGQAGMLFRQESERPSGSARAMYSARPSSEREEEISSPQEDQPAPSSLEEEPLIIPSSAFVASTAQTGERRGSSSQGEEELLIELVDAPVRTVYSPAPIASYEAFDLAFIAHTLNDLLDEFLDVEEWLDLVTSVMDAAGDQLDECGADILEAVKDLIEATRDLIEEQGEAIVEMLRPLAEAVQTLSNERGDDISTVIRSIKAQVEDFARSLRGASHDAIVDRTQRFLSELFIDRGEEIAIIIQPLISELEALIVDNKEELLALVESLRIPLDNLRNIVQEKFLEVLQPVTRFLQNFFTEHEMEFSAMAETRSMQELGEQLARLRSNPRDQFIARQLFGYWVRQVSTQIQPSVEAAADLIFERRGDFLNVITPLVIRARALFAEQRAEFSRTALSLVETARAQVDQRRDELSAMVAPLTHLVELIEASLERDEEIGLKYTPIPFSFPSTGIAWFPGDYHLEITLNDKVANRQIFQIV